MVFPIFTYWTRCRASLSQPELGEMRRTKMIAELRRRPRRRGGQRAEPRDQTQHAKAECEFQCNAPAKPENGSRIVRVRGQCRCVAAAIESGQDNHGRKQ